MPFSESGITPDVIINPNAFPSRMTIGMLIESLAGKAGALNGEIKRVRGFDYCKDDDPVGYFGKELVEHGYNYYGNELLYSGIYGNVMKADIFIGVVYYQRLRHMVSDKSQARATGPVDVLTRQPVKGRKKGGGIRLGEMERDALLAHGIPFCLHDRLLNSSDYSEGFVCEGCGNLLSSYSQVTMKKDDVLNQEISKVDITKKYAYCRVCDAYNCHKVIVPWILRYLTNELAAMNIKLTFGLE
jgi:DNA-directed RNA polymerase I subunit RPA2